MNQGKRPGQVEGSEFFVGLAFAGIVSVIIVLLIVEAVK